MRANKRTGLRALSLALGIIVCTTGCQTSAEGDSVGTGTVFANAIVIDPATRTRTEGAWVHVTDGRIQATGTGVAPAAEVVHDLRGAYLMPGLVDAHLHLTAGPLEVTVEDGVPSLSMESRPEVTRFNARAALASGITSAFSPAGDPEANHDYARRQASGEWMGPRLVYAGFIFDPTPIRGGSVYPEGERGWRQELARQKRLGAGHVKLYSGLTSDELVRGIQLADEAGMKSIAHLDAVSWQVAVDAGIDALTHALPTSADLLPESERAAYRTGLSPTSARHLYRWFERVDFDAPPMRRLIDDLAREQVRVDLTLVVNELMYFFPEIADRFPDQGWYVHPDLADWATNLGRSLHDWTEEDYARAQSVLPKVFELLRRLEASGVPLLIGSDSGSGGPWFWRELELHQEAGLEPWRILQMATSDAADLLELGLAGHIVSGYDADFVILEEDPTVHVSAIRSLTHIVQGGERLDVQALRAELRCQASPSCSNPK